MTFILSVSKTLIVFRCIIRTVLQVRVVYLYPLSNLKIPSGRDVKKKDKNLETYLFLACIGGKYNIK